VPIMELRVTSRASLELISENLKVHAQLLAKIKQRMPQ